MKGIRRMFVSTVTIMGLVYLTVALVLNYIGNSWQLLFLALGVSLLVMVALIAMKGGKG